VGPVLVVGNVAMAVAVAAVAWHWHRARRAADPVAPDAVEVRLRHRGLDPEVVDRCVDRGLGRAGLSPVGRGSWADRAGGAARVLGPVTGDRAVLVELTPDQADAAVAGILAEALDEGYEVTRRVGRRVELRQGSDRLVLALGRA